MAIQMVNMVLNNKEVVELIRAESVERNSNQKFSGEIEQFPPLSEWLNVKKEKDNRHQHQQYYVAPKAMSKEKTFEQRKSDQRLTANGYLQNKHMGRASKKDWYSDIAYMRNIFALLTV